MPMRQGKTRPATNYNIREVKISGRPTKQAATYNNVRQRGKKNDK